MAEYVTIKTTLGEVRGVKVNSVLSGSYSSFKGIPYGKPPVGDLRFKNPEPAEPWTGVRDAIQHGAVCPAVDFLTRQLSDGSNEDCLLVNVYTPIVNPKEKLPVLVWIHGGGFAAGSGNDDMYGPDYIVKNDVVLVTLNYRLNVFGFLSLENQECPGNYGLKDMVLALKWVQQNISSFGGNPNKVTIFGESAGGAAVSYLMISPLTDGLFHGAISQSGNLLNPWAFSRKPKHWAFLLGEKLGLKTTNETELLNFLKTVEPNKLAEAADNLQKDHDPNEFYLSLAFVPSVEPEGTPGAFLTKTPLQMIEEGHIKDVPYINGLNTLEGLIISSRRTTEELDQQNFKRLIPANITVPRDSEQAQEICEKIKKHYFSKGYDYTSEVKALNSTYFTIGIAYTIRKAVLSNRKSPMFTYLFTYDGDEALIKNFLNCKIPGTVHGDELTYLFTSKIPGVDTTLKQESSSYNNMKAMTKLWTNFAKTGNPTSELEGRVQIKWEPTTKDSNCYLNIGDELKMEKDLEKEELLFWRDVYKSIGF